MTLQVYLNFNGNCQEALDFYSKVFSTKKQNILRFGDVPPNTDHPLPAAAKDRIMHTFLNIEGNMVMFSDVLPGMPFTVGNNVSLILQMNDTERMKTIFGELADGGDVSMELQETFWSKCYGFVTDKYGIGWQFNYKEKT